MTNEAYGIKGAIPEEWDRLDSQGRRTGQQTTIDAGVLEALPQAATEPQAPTKPARKTTHKTQTPYRPTSGRERLVADTPSQAHAAAMQRVRDGAPVKLTEEQRVFGAEQAQRIAEMLGKIGTEA